jgi:hypothetical protein
MTDGQKLAMAEQWPRYGLEAGSGMIDPQTIFGRMAPLVFEIGFGMGGSLVDMARAHPELDYIGVEVHTPGIGNLLRLADAEGLSNLRVYKADAKDVLKHCIPDGSLAAVQIFFPDPWHKKRHHKRRLVQPAFVALLASGVSLQSLARPFLIVAIGVSNQPSDAVHLLPMLERIKANTGELPDALIADAGYCSTANLEACEEKGLQAYISTSRQQHGQRPRPSRGRAPRDLDARGRMERKLRSKAGQTVYALRKTIVEPVFGQIKGARGLDRFRLRGLEKVNGEWALMATTHNLLKLFRASLATA